ncbi:uncharacterized protein L201_004552 [Kwoniella dendrophila CBS 6074]|uniref:Carrier domain-containing protein n=1 Tax=Kwoniella dendrophila CBS 6074 TaxID=1295534 RepID=A0AAX4JW84_9TREE
MTLSYLVSTAGHAQHQNEKHPHDTQTILQLIADGAKEFGSEKVVGFAAIQHDDEGWKCDRFSFPDLLGLSARLASGLMNGGVSRKKDGEHIISLLCPTGLDFLVAWIALMRLGYGVVLIAPQCSPSAIAHLYNSSSSSQLVFHQKYYELAKSAQEIDPGISLVQLPSLYNSDSPLADLPCIVENANNVSHVFHTSGTSGTPKPIPNTHNRSVTVLPHRALPTYLTSSASSDNQTVASPSESAAFTTTPLFHGGVSDLLRAWMARSMIYFYPTSEVPITTKNVVDAVNSCQSPASPLEGIQISQTQQKERETRFRVNSFLSVPYILSTLAEDVDGPGMQLLKSLDYVSTGGAPLDTKIGDMMVSKGVNLVSRLGSSECGFLLSSHRDYQTERDWEWLRNDSPYADALVFEPVDKESSPNEARFEMVVTDSWTSKTKSNREDGSYATGDLYQKHPSKENVWRYAGRGDDVIVLSNGEKASPGPIETVLRSSPHLSDALVVGSDQSQIGILLFPRQLPPQPDLLNLIIPLLEEANQSSPSFAQVSKEMCVLITDTNKALPKSSKGTIQRGVAYEVFKSEINTLYQGQDGQTDSQPRRSLKDIVVEVRKIIEAVAASKLKIGQLDTDTDLFSWGVDSLMATRARTALQKQLYTGGTVLPNNVVFERPSIQRLSRYIFDLQENNASNGSDEEDTHQLMEILVKKYGEFDYQANSNVKSSPNAKSGKTVLLTGATGSLGSFLVQELSQIGQIDEIICLVRAENDQVANQRVKGALKNRGFPSQSSKEIKCFAADLAKPNLGLSSPTYQSIVDKVDIVIHAAWPVHFTSSLVSFEDSIKGTRQFIDLVSKTNSAKLYYCSSLASVLGQDSPKVVEQPSNDPSTATPIGYSQSKWVTEKICRLANETATLNNRIHILRVGQLCGDTQSGHWNEKEGWPLLIRTAQTSGTLPTLQEKPSWLPVDLAARAITDISTAEQGDPALIYHIVHPHNINWNIVLDGIEKAGISFKRVSALEWLKKVEATSDDMEENPSKQMLHMWEAAYGTPGETQPEIFVDITNAARTSKTMSTLQDIDLHHMVKMVKAWQRTGFLRE